MPDLYCQITDDDTEDGCPRIDVIDSDTLVQAPYAIPPSGYGFQYPIKANGHFLCYRLPANENINVHAHNAQVYVDGLIKTRPKMSEGFLGLTISTWGPAGHGTFQLDGRITSHARIDKKFFGITLSQEWRCITTDRNFTPTSCRNATTKDQVEPSVDSLGRLAYVDKKLEGATYHKVCIAGQRIATPGFAFDPCVSPNGQYVAWLVGAENASAGSSTPENILNVRWAIYVAEIADHAATTVAVVPSVLWDLNTQPFWLDDDTLVFSKYSGGIWRLRTVTREAPYTQEWLTDSSHGSINMASVDHDS